MFFLIPLKVLVESFHCRLALLAMAMGSQWVGGRNPSAARVEENVFFFCRMPLECLLTEQTQAQLSH